MNRHARNIAGVTAAAVAAIGALGAASPAVAHEGGPGRGPGGGPGGGHGGGARSGQAFTLTSDATAILDDYEAEVEAVGSARVRRNDDDLIVVSLGRGMRHHRGESETGVDGVSFTAAAGASTWTGFAFDPEAGVVTADVDGVEDVAVLDMASTTDESRPRGPRRPVELALTDQGADALDAVVGADEFEAGDVFATAGGACRSTASTTS